jgi:hypothetical protein
MTFVDSRVGMSLLVLGLWGCAFALLLLRDRIAPNFLASNPRRDKRAVLILIATPFVLLLVSLVVAAARDAIG